MRRKRQWKEIVEDDVKGYWQEPAPAKAVKLVLAAPVESKTQHDGRSQWLWIRLPDGDLILGVYPQGDTYFATEHLRTI